MILVFCLFGALVFCAAILGAVIASELLNKWKARLVTMRTSRSRRKWFGGVR